MIFVKTNTLYDVHFIKMFIHVYTHKLINYLTNSILHYVKIVHCVYNL